ncbi:MAG: glycosyltransferase [Bryobacterales bacterium]
MPERTTDSPRCSGNDASVGTPRVSIIVPTYNRRAFLADALESIWAQTYQDFEVIVVDDGSTDDTREYLEGLREPRLRSLFRPHAGVCEAANAGLRAARGELVARLDSDDTWLPDMLEVEIAALDARPDAGLVYARAQFVDAKGNPKGRTTGMPLRFPGDSLRSMLYEDCTTQCTIVARRKALEVIGLYDSDLATSEDWDLWLRFARRHTFVFLDRVTAHYRMHEGNSTSNRNRLRFATMLETRRKVLDKFFSDDNVPVAAQAMRPRAYGNYFIDCGVRLLAGDQPRRAVVSFGRALRADPHPVTFARIVWFSVARTVLDRLPGGWQFVEWTGNVRRHGRAQHA